MNRVDALSALFSESSHIRFQAAHALVKLAEPQDLDTVKEAKRNETVAYVISRLDAVIKHCSDIQQVKKVEIQPLDDSKFDTDLLKIARASAIEWVSGLLLHEIGSKLGLIALTISSELKNYEQSKTKKHISNIQAIFDAIEQLRLAANPSQYEHFDLSDLIDDIASIENSTFNVEFILVGARPFMITGSKQLIRLALCNGLRNAFEAVKQVTDRSMQTTVKPVVIAWGSSDIEYWISVIDDGDGIIGSVKNVFDVGKSTKSGHPGFGLSIAKQALDTLGGSVTLESSQGGGAKYEIRWKISV